MLGLREKQCCLAVQERKIVEQKILTCIGCPLGCRITVELENENVISVNGNTCIRGENYAKKEITCPARIVTSTVKVIGGAVSVVSVKTKYDIPKDKIFDCVRELKKVEVKAPVAIGDVLLADVCGTGVDIVATKNVDAI